MRCILHKIKKVIIRLQAARQNPNLRHLKEEIATCYRNAGSKEDAELREAAAFIEANGLCVFPRSFCQKIQ